jgi:hypothetical protein
MSKIEVNQISSQCGSTLTIGQSGDTVTLASGATQSGFGRTGTVDWDTTAKTASFTAVSGNGYFVNTTSGAITVTMPATPSAGDIVALQDYAGTWGTNNVTIGRNGSNIGGIAVDPTLSTSDQSITLVYVDSTRGWQTVNDSTQSVAGAQYVTATGGTVTCCGDYKIHTFTGPGTFCVSCAGNPLGSTQIDYLVIAGGGAGGTTNGSSGAGGGGGGAGGYRESSGAASGCYTVSPLGSGVSALPVTVTGYPVTVGAGGATAPFPQPGLSASNPGSNSVFAGSTTITSTGGGGGSNVTTTATGGSGGGAAGSGCVTIPGGAGNTPPVSPSQGNPGGATLAAAPFFGAGGGGGATAAGVDGTPTVGGNGGAGATSSINGTPTIRAGGGGGGTYAGPPGTGGTAGSGGPGGGGNGGTYPQGEINTAGAANTGGGGGGTGSNPDGTINYSGKAGGSGIVIIRYKYQ